MRLSSINYNKAIMYKANDVTKTSQAPKTTDSKDDGLNKGYKNTMLLAAGIGLLAIGLCMRKSIGKLYKEIFQPVEKKTRTIKPNEHNIDRALELNKNENIEEIIPEVTDFDTVFGPRIRAKRQQMKPKSNDIIVIDEKGNIIRRQKKSQNNTDNPFESRFNRQNFRNNNETRSTIIDDAKNTAFDTADTITDCLILDEIINGSISGGRTTVEEVIGGIEKGNTGLFDSITEKISNLGDDIGGFFDNIGDNLGDIGESIGDSLGDIF